MKIILFLLIPNLIHKVYSQFSNNFNTNQAQNINNNRGFEIIQIPLTQYIRTVSSNVQNQNILNSNQRNRATENYQIKEYNANQNPILQSQHEISKSIQNQNNPKTKYSANDVQPERKSLSRLTSENFKNTQQHFMKNTPLFNTEGITFDTRSLVNLDEADSQNFSNSNEDIGSTQPSFQYQYSKGWSVHEAISANDIVIPHLEDQKYSKYSTPNAPDAQYYQKFYNIYSHVEHQTQQDLGQYEKESINDDFNGRSIVAPGQYPHMAAIGFLSNEEKIEFKCGGSLISKSFVITAAHCCYLNGETPILVKLGIINLKDQSGNSDPQRRAIKEIIVHPSYNSTMTYNDIALLKLQAPVEFTKFVRPILLWSSDDIPYGRVFTMGYGSTSFAKAPTNILTELSLSLIPLDKCKELLPRDEKTPYGVQDSQICGRDNEKNRDTCQGDSGGPLQLNFEHRRQRNTYRYYLVGIISYGEFCGSKKPGVYTRVSSYCRWIASEVWPNFEM